MIPLLSTNAFIFCSFNTGEIFESIVHPPMPPASNTGNASNNMDVSIDDGDEPYGIARAVKLNDDHPIRLIQEDMDCIKHVCCHDPLVHDFSDLSESHIVYAKGIDDEFLVAPHGGGGMRTTLKLIRDLYSTSCLH